MPKPRKVVVIVEDGLVAEVWSDVLGLEVVVADKDCSDEDEEKQTQSVIDDIARDDLKRVY